LKFRKLYDRPANTTHSLTLISISSLRSLCPSIRVHSFKINANTLQAVQQAQQDLGHKQTNKNSGFGSLRDAIRKWKKEDLNNNQRENKNKDKESKERSKKNDGKKTNMNENEEEGSNDNHSEENKKKRKSRKIYRDDENEEEGSSDNHSEENKKKRKSKANLRKFYRDDENEEEEEAEEEKKKKHLRITQEPVVIKEEQTSDNLLTDQQLSSTPTNQPSSSPNILSPNPSVSRSIKSSAKHPQRRVGLSKKKKN
jgi:hypothetical protein